MLGHMSPRRRQLDNAVRAYLRELGHRGGKAGGKRGGQSRMSNLTAEQKSALGKKAAAARWKKKATQKHA